MTRSFTMPDLGEGLTEAEIVGWLVAPGDTVTVDQPVVELESAKSVVQLPSPHAGVVERLGGDVGQVLHAGDVLLTLRETTDASVPGPTPAAQALAEPASAGPGSAAPVAAEPGIAVPTEVASEESGAVLIGYGTRASARVSKPVTAGRFGRRGGPTAGREGQGDQRPAGASAAATALLEPGRCSPVVSPIVRRLARSHGFDAAQLLGTGPEHLVLRRDVERAIAERAGGATVTTEQAAAPTSAVRPSAPSVPSATADRRVPLDRHARAAAAQFSRSRREIPEATVWLDVDASALIAARRELEGATGERFGLTALVARIAVAGLARHPALNASFDAEREELVLHGAVNLGVATQTPRGLLVPVVHGAERLSLRALRDGLAERSAQAGTGTFPPAALTGGTFTLNNYGALGVDGSAAIINHPEAAMLGIGRLVERPWVVDGRIEPRTVTELTLSFDHRVCDGAEAAAFLTFVAGCIERPISLLADL
ncbi:dihydrolipoamide acetyltransferase family protein [Agromyces sp. G08B096]|uniref:Dihydrolipoamide acetyltransferase component of pyruvate dehydrogenase complex n=1 Tax=Agromyces sp. G08B096 TaxID=3156399 RepID=A0AAU7WC27_9MICO